MSARSGIVKAIAEKMRNEINGTAPYINNLYGNVSSKVTHFDDINDYPYITVTPGPEQREDLPSAFTWSDLTVYIRIYVDNRNDAQGELEDLIADIETFVDTNLVLSYNVNTPSGVETNQTVTNTIISITTDEGILDPKALGEIVLTVRYEKLRA